MISDSTPMRLLPTLLLLVTSALAQDDLRFLSATTFQDPATSTNHAYLMWQAENPETLRGLSLEVFGKPGQPPSPAPFTRRGRMAFQTNVAVLDALLDSLPDELVQAALLEERIDGLFGSLLPDAGLSLAMKVSGVLQVAEHDPAVFRRLVFFSRAHPFVGIAMGTAGTFPLNTPVTTFELRSAAGNDAVVEARVTLDLNNPPAIPAPGPPVHVVDPSASGHLNAKIRWGIPDALARNTALTYGFNLYRIERTFAERSGLHTAPPTPAAVTSLLASDPDEVALVNRVPVMPIANLPPAEAADLVADPDTAFITDDRGVILDQATTPFNDGDAFYYYVAARDILGRPGTLSPGTLITVCDRQRPQPPIRVRVNHIRDATAPVPDFLRVSWETPPDGDPPDFYYVYRWENPSQMLQAAHPFVPAAHLVSAAIPHDPSLARHHFDDAGAGAPRLVPGGFRTTGDDGKTYWYSVRAVKSTACGPLHSGNSSPAWGVLRDRIGPNAAGASTVLATTSYPEVTLGNMSTRALGPAESPLSYSGNGTHYLRLTVTRTDPRVDAAILYRYFLGEDPVRLGQKRFTSGDEVLEVRLAVPATVFNTDNLRFVAVARDARGRVDFEEVNAAFIPNPDNGRVAEVPFFAGFVQKTTTVSGGGVGDDPLHDSVDPDTGETNPLEVTFDPSADAREFKLYKRIDGGALLLVEQGEVGDPAVEITLEDVALPANSSQVCYFVQYFDEHGNPSPLADLGCVRTTAKVDLPVPILARPEQAGTEADPQVTLRWFSETEGVERFRVHIDAGDTPPAADDYSPELQPVRIGSLTATRTTIGSAPPTSPFFGRESAPSSSSFTGAAVGFTPYQTGRVGGNFGDPARPNEFEVTFRVASGRDYRFFIESVSPAGDTSAPSNTESFTWSPSPDASGPLVPWPARSLPPVDDAFIPELKAQYLRNGPENRYYAVVKIGEITSTNPDVGVSSSLSGADGGAFRVPAFFIDDGDRALRLYTSRGGETALPFVLYRHQVANEHFPEVSGDVVQVSPLLDRIRTLNTTKQNTPVVEIADPFLDLLWDSDGGHNGVYLKDTQGVVRGATYQYTLVRFEADGEIDRSIPLTPLTIPLTDP